MDSDTLAADEGQKVLKLIVLSPPISPPRLTGPGPFSWKYLLLTGSLDSELLNILAYTVFSDEQGQTVMFKNRSSESNLIFTKSYSQYVVPSTFQDPERASTFCHSFIGLFGEQMNHFLPEIVFQFRPFSVLSSLDNFLKKSKNIYF